MGPVRLERYGSALLEVFAQQSVMVPASQGKSAKEEAWLLFGEGRPLAEISQRVDRQPSTVIGYLEAWIGLEGGSEAWRWYAQSLVAENIQIQIDQICQQRPEISLRELFDDFHGAISFDQLRIGRAVYLRSWSAAHAGG
jgi:ATP-dependent DNA helicase RecQ